MCVFWSISIAHFDFAVLSHWFNWRIGHAVYWKPSCRWFDFALTIYQNSRQHFPLSVKQWNQNWKSMDVRYGLRIQPVLAIPVKKECRERSLQAKSSNFKRSSNWSIMDQTDVSAETFQLKRFSSVSSLEARLSSAESGGFRPISDIQLLDLLGSE